MDLFKEFEHYICTHLDDSYRASKFGAQVPPVHRAGQSTDDVVVAEDELFAPPWTS